MSRDISDSSYVTPEELYSRQNGLCYLAANKLGEEYIVYCTDGSEAYPLSSLSNPTKECSLCMSKFFNFACNKIKNS